jgi:predicted membrane metal-binding protein
MFPAPSDILKLFFPYLFFNFPFIFAGIYSVFSFKDLRAPIWKTRFFTNPYLFASITFSLFGLLIAFFVEPITKILRLAVFDPTDHLVLIIGVILANIMLVEMAKSYFFSRKAGV